MKSEERHRLRENELEHVVKTTGSVLERHATTIVAVVCGVMLVAAVVIWWMRQTTATSSTAWTLLENAQSVDDFGSIAEKYKNTPAGDWARLRESEANLRSGGEVLFSDRDLANTDLKRAREGFEQLLASSSTSPIIRERAIWGLARCLESTSDGDTTKAIEAYQRLLNDFPETIYKPFAEDRIAALKTGGTKEFYAWFSKQNPKPADIRPKDGAAKNPLDPFLPPAAAGEADGKSNGDEATTPTSKTNDPAADKPIAAEVVPDTKKDESTPAKPDEAKPDEAKAEKKPESDESKPDAKPEKSTDDSDKKQP
ncbi:MAG: tetratricopeptide repeat protein [Planctomycetota bacterium]